MASLSEIQALYDRNLYLDAFRESAEYWNSAIRLEDLSLEELVLGGRLALRLGGMRLSRWLRRAAWLRNPSDPSVRYFAQGMLRHNEYSLAELLARDENPELPGADPGIQASWISRNAVIWATLRDFDRAHAAIARARSFHARVSVVLSFESDVLGIEDRWYAALASAELAWELDPGSPFIALNIGECLLNLGRTREAAERLAQAAENSQSFEISRLASWYLCAFAETLSGSEHAHALSRAQDFADRLGALAPLADRESNDLFARIKLDIAESRDDHSAMRRWAAQIRSPFHRKTLENLQRNPEGLRIRLPYRRAIQKHETCLPTSVASALSAMNLEINADTMAAEITFGGTAEWAAADWLEERGLAVKFFAVIPEVAARLLKNGIPFVVTLEGDDHAHAVAAVGLDEAVGTLIIHDPQSFRTTEYLLSSVGKDEAPLGPKGMAIVPSEKAALLDQLLPPDDADAMSATEAYQRAMLLQGPAAAGAVVADLVSRHPSHPITRLLEAMHTLQDGRVGMALVEYQELARMFPGSAIVRSRLLSCCRALGDTALMRATLQSVVERGLLPGIQSQQAWRHPPGAYVSEFADLLRMSDETRAQARAHLDSLIRREITCAPAWHVLADLLWGDHEIPGALLAYRIAAQLASSHEHYARAYCDALCQSSRQEEGLSYLEDRVRRFGASAPGVSTWITWIVSLENWGQPERALAACEDALKVHGDIAELLSFVVPFWARMARWQEAEDLLGRLEKAGNSARYHEAAADFYSRRGALNDALVHAEAWMVLSPLSMSARHELLSLINRRDGALAALKRACTWADEQPHHDEFEQMVCEYLGETSAPRRKKYSVLLRRLKRNSEDAWAWRELAFTCISDYESKSSRRRRSLARRIPTLLAQCERTAAGDAPTSRVRAQWCEARGEWDAAIEHWLESIRLDPGHGYGYRRVWECAARCDQQKQQQCWQAMSKLLLTYSGRLSVARETILMAAGRFGVAEAERVVTLWRDSRPDDPEVNEAMADLLLERGHGLTDAQRALDLLRPAVDRFPYHIGLRFSLARALRTLGDTAAAEAVLLEIIRRHPGNSPAQIQLARVQERHNCIDDAMQTLETAAHRDPRNVDIRDVEAQILISAGRFKDAHRVVTEAVARFPESVHWRERAIRLFVSCGDEEAAVRTAREGIVVYPTGAYLWFLLGRALNDHRRFAGQREIESCLQRSLALNEGLFDAADLLVRVLVEQRRYGEAESVMEQIRERLDDPTPARGRLAWIHRQTPEKSAACVEMLDVLRASPWYVWGWLRLMEWWSEDKSWGDARRELATLSPELAANVDFRRQRLLILELAQIPAKELDEEWGKLLAEFPEDVALHLLRYDSLRDSQRLAEAARVLETIRKLDPENPYILARYTEVLAADSTKKDEAAAAVQQIFFGGMEQSSWTADHAWKAIRGAHWEEIVYEQCVATMKAGSAPAPRALFILAAHAAQLGRSEKRNFQSPWRNWFPARGGRELLALLAIVESSSWPKVKYRGTLLTQLCDLGYMRRVVRCWNAIKADRESDVESWAQAGRSLIRLKKRSAARKLLGCWRQKPGVNMWVVANYALCLPQLLPKGWREMNSTAQDALSVLPHDHTAKYLVHRQAEACALLGDTNAFKEIWNKHLNYFDAKLEKQEWFETERKHLLLDIPIMGRALDHGNRKMYRRMLRSIRWKRFIAAMQWSRLAKLGIAPRWWWFIVFWLIYLTISVLTSPNK